MKTPLTRGFQAFATWAIVFGAGCGDNSVVAPPDAGSQPAFACSYSQAKSGGLCQVNFFCDAGDGPAAYCDSAGACACGAAAQNPREFTHAGICETTREEMARIVNEACSFGL